MPPDCCAHSALVSFCEIYLSVGCSVAACILHASQPRVRRPQTALLIDGIVAARHLLVLVLPRCQRHVLWCLSAIGSAHLLLLLGCGCLRKVRQSTCAGRAPVRRTTTFRATAFRSWLHRRFRPYLSSDRGASRHAPRLPRLVQPPSSIITLCKVRVPCVPLVNTASEPNPVWPLHVFRFSIPRKCVMTLLLDFCARHRTGAVGRT